MLDSIHHMTLNNFELVFFYVKHKRDVERVISLRFPKICKLPVIFMQGVFHPQATSL